MIRKTENRKVASSVAAVASQMAFVNHGCSVPSVPVAGQHYWKLLLALPKLRVARPTDDIEALIRFYGDGLGLEILYRFEDHDGFDGVMLGHAGAPYHFEFTKAHGHTVGRAPTRDNLLVFCLPDPGEWQVAVERMEGAGFRAVPAFNPYWDRSGRTFEDPDGYRVVIQRADWNA